MGIWVAVRELDEQKERVLLSMTEENLSSLAVVQGLG